MSEPLTPAPAPAPPSGVDTCDTCRCYILVPPDPGTKKASKALCRKRLHSGSLGSKIEKQFVLGRGNVPTGNRTNIIVSYFPETRPDWWCSEYQFAGSLKPPTEA